MSALVLRAAAAIALAGAVILAFAGWLQPASVFTFLSAVAFCQ